MKVLLDENVPRKLKYRFSENFDLFTVPEMGWSGIKNGDLLEKMELKGFSILISLDKNMSSQQNLKKFKISLIVLNSKDTRYNALIRYVKLVENILLNKEISTGLILIE